MDKIKLTKEQIGDLGIYDFQCYIGAMNQSTFGGKEGTARLISQLELNKTNETHPHSILEIACSTGYNSIPIAKNYNCNITGIDISEISIKRAQEKLNKINLDNIKFEVADAQNLPFENESFDRVFGEAIVALLPEKENLLNEFLRVTKKGGKIATLDLFYKDDTPSSIIDEINQVMSSVLGYDVSILSLNQWKKVYRSLNLQHQEITDYYDSIFVRTTSFWSTIPIMFKLIYHLCFNKKIRRKILPTIPLARKMLNKKSKLNQSLGYLIFIGTK